MVVTTASTRSSLMVRGAPQRGSSSRPAKPRSIKRVRHLPTVLFVSRSSAGDLSAGVACRAAQDNLGALGQAMARLATMGPSQQFGPILGGDDQLRVVGTAAWHDVNFSERPVSSHDTISRISVSGH